MGPCESPVVSGSWTLVVCDSETQSPGFFESGLWSLVVSDSETLSLVVFEPGSWSLVSDSETRPLVISESGPYCQVASVPSSLGVSDSGSYSVVLSEVVLGSLVIVDFEPWTLTASDFGPKILMRILLGSGPWILVISDSGPLSLM